MAGRPCRDLRTEVAETGGHKQPDPHAIWQHEMVAGMRRGSKECRSLQKSNIIPVDAGTKIRAGRPDGKFGPVHDRAAALCPSRRRIAWRALRFSWPVAWLH